MELTAEQITEMGLNEDQAGKINAWSSETVANTKKEYDGKANTDAENILSGASKKIFEDTKVERNQGEKMGDYIPRAWGEFNTSKLDEIEAAKSDYEKKLKNFSGNEDLISKITTLESEKDSLLQKYADYKEIKEKAEKYDPLNEKYSKTKIEVAFNSVKPSFPKEVNSYEAKSKWDDFKKEILEKYNLEIVDGEAKAIDKENEHRSVKLSELLSKNEDISKLTQGRQQKGAGAKAGNTIDIDGVPFKVPEGAEKDSTIRTKAIKDYLAEQGLSVLSGDFSKKFAEFNSKIQSKK